ncbi:MAG: DUF1579 domain-containing protein [Phyllobacterium sp.]
MKSEPQKEHEFLQKLIGEWTVTSDMMPESPDIEWVEDVRSLQGLWIVAEGNGEMPGGGAATTILTLGYDPAKKSYVGTWIGSMMTHMWIYKGAIDGTGKTLVLDTEGPDFAQEGKTAKYREIIAFTDSDHRTFTSEVQSDDGSWKQIMTTRYTRKKRQAA